MSRYVVRFLKNVVGDDHLEVEACLQRFEIEAQDESEMAKGSSAGSTTYRFGRFTPTASRSTTRIFPHKARNSVPSLTLA
jgi:hypothetical protein